MRSGLDGPEAVTRADAVAAYEHAWSLSDEAAIGVELERCWTAHSTHVTPLTDVIIGIDALTRLILDIPVMFPGAHVRATSPADFHHDAARFAWQLESTARIRMLGQDFGFQVEGLDYLEFDRQDRICRVVAFFGPLTPDPHPPTATASTTPPAGTALGRDAQVASYQRRDTRDRPVHPDGTPRGSRRRLPRPATPAVPVPGAP